MPNKTTRPGAETPEPFPSLPTPSELSHAKGEQRPPRGAAAPSYRDLASQLVPLPDSSHRPTLFEAEEAELPRDVKVSAGGGAFPAADTMRAAVAALEGVDATDLELDVVGGSVTLSGSVARSSDRDRIVTALGKLHGVTEVLDRLRVRLE